VNVEEEGIRGKKRDVYRGEKANGLRKGVISRVKGSLLRGGKKKGGKAPSWLGGKGKPVT